MIPYLTNRGGPVVGVEALALQGLPIDELILTRENTDQLADLAGNAMSSTVVGAAIAAALVVAGHTLVDREYPALDDAKMEDSEVLSEEQLEARFRGSDRLVEHPVDLTSVKPVPQNLLERAHRSARRCTCEGRSGLTTVGIVQCLSCNYSSCETHAGKPEHVYVKDTAEREKPKQFETDLKEYLPMRLTISGFDRESLVKLVAPAEERGAKFSKKTLKRYLDIVSAAVEGAEVRLFLFRLPFTFLQTSLPLCSSTSVTSTAARPGAPSSRPTPLVSNSTSSSRAWSGVSSPSLPPTSPSSTSSVVSSSSPSLASRLRLMLPTSLLAHGSSSFLSLTRARPSS